MFAGYRDCGQIDVRAQLRNGTKKPRRNCGANLAHDPEKWEPVSRLREARFGGRRKVGKDHAQAKC